MNPLEARRRLLGRNAYKRTTEGNPAIARGSLARRYPGITMQGWTEQEGTPTPETPVPIVSAGTQNQDAGKYQYEVKLTGKNLFDAEYFRTTLDWKQPADVIGYPYIPIYIGKGNTITISTDGTPAEGLGFYCTIARTNKNTSNNVYTWIYHSTNANLIKTNVSFGVVEDDYIYFSLNTGHGNIEKFLNAFTNFQIEISAQKTEYQPYKEQTVILTSDRPLTKWDRLEKRAGQWGWGYKSAEVVLDGSEDENWKVTASSTYTFIIDINGAMFRNSYCDRYICMPVSWVSNNFGVYSDNGFATKYFRPPSADVETVEQWKTFLSQNPLTVVCETAEETFVPLSPEEQESMNALYTFRPTTVLSNDCECEMTLTYKTKKSLEVTT